MMNVFEYNPTEKVYYIAPDRIVKKLDDQQYETYRVTVLDHMKLLTINTVDFNEIDADYIDQQLANCGLIYNRENNQIVQMHDQEKVLEDDDQKIPYIIADRLSYSGYVDDSVTTYQFNNAMELNEILLEHDIPIKFTNSLLEDL